MKRTMKYVMVALAIIFMANTANAQQKFGYINSLELLSVMPQVGAADARIEAFYKGKTR